MDREDLIKLKRKVEAEGFAPPNIWPEIVRLCELVAAAERNKVAAWMTQRGYATGHGDTVEDLLKELEWQIRESEREACAKLCETMWHEWLDSPEENEPNKPDAEDCYRAIRARGQA